MFFLEVAPLLEWLTVERVENGRDEDGHRRLALDSTENPYREEALPQSSDPTASEQPLSGPAVESIPAPNRIETLSKPPSRPQSLAGQKVGSAYLSLILIPKRHDQTHRSEENQAENPKMHHIKDELLQFPHRGERIGDRSEARNLFPGRDHKPQDYAYSKWRAVPDVPGEVQLATREKPTSDCGGSH